VLVPALVPMLVPTVVPVLVPVQVPVQVQVQVPALLSVLMLTLPALLVVVVLLLLVAVLVRRSHASAARRFRHQWKSVAVPSRRRLAKQNPARRAPPLSSSPTEANGLPARARSQQRWCAQLIAISSPCSIAT
jgi:hypothetical protein